MKNTAKNSLRYTGIVKLSQYINNEKTCIAELTNSGGIPLFEFFTNCLSWNFDLAKSSIPYQIMVLATEYDQDTGEAKGYTAKSGLIPITSLPEKINDVRNARGVRYSFVVPREQLTDYQFDSIGLYAKNINGGDASSIAKNFSAIVMVPDTIRNTLRSSAALVIDWELYISNKEDVV